VIVIYVPVLFVHPLYFLWVEFSDFYVNQSLAGQTIPISQATFFVRSASGPVINLVNKNLLRTALQICMFHFN
jgi:hypothetical protein